MSENSDQPLRFKTCRVCGQRFDTEDIEQIYHHGAVAHEPLNPGPDLMQPDGALAKSLRGG